MRRSPSPCCLTVLFLVLATGIAHAQSVALTDMSDIKKAGVEITKEQPVDFEATVSYVHSLWNFVFLQDGSQAIFGYGQQAGSMKAGDRVRVRGVLKKGALSPIIEIGVIEVVEHPAGEPLVPEPIDISKLKIGDFDAQYVTLECKILQIYITGQNVLVYAETDKTRFYLNATHSVREPEQLMNLVGQDVRCTGSLGLQIINRGAFDDPGSSPDSEMNFKLFCVSMDEIVPLNPSPKSDMIVTQAPVHSLLADRRREGRFLTYGQVVLIDYDKNGPHIFIRDGSDALRLECETAFNVYESSVVRVAGERRSDANGEPTYHADFIQWMARSRLVPAPTRKIGDFLEDHPPNQRVALEGAPSRLRMASNKTVAWIALTDEDSSVELRLQGEALDGLESLNPNMVSRVRVVGIPTASDRDDAASRVQIVISRLSDIQILSSRIPLTRMLVIGAISCLAVCLLAFLAFVIWVRLLRKTVAEKTKHVLNAAAQLRASYDAVGDGVLAIDTQQTTLAVNKEFLRLTESDLEVGQDATEIVGRILTDLRQVADLPETLKDLQDWQTCPQLHQSVEAELQVKEPQKVTVRISPIHSTESDGHIGFLIVLRDETEKRKLETELLHAGKLEAVGRMVSGVAHDFNNALCVVASSLSVSTMEEEVSVGEIKESLLMAEDATFKAADIVRRLLNFSTDKVLDLKPQKINAIIERLDEMAGRTIDKGIQFVLNLSPDNPTVMVDRTAIEQVLLNLYLNAKDAMPEGGTVEISTEVPSNAPDKSMVISVRDSGSGIPADIADKIFDPFFTTKDIDHGTGLGLSVSHRTVQQHDGSLFYQPLPTGGSEFRIVLPICTDPGVLETDSPATPLEKGSGTILVVDDEDVLRVVTETMLRRYGYETVSASNGRAALSLLASTASDIDAILLDLAMPGMSGREVLKHINQRYPLIPVVVCSGYLIADYLQPMTEPKPQSEIQKPFTLERLVTTMHNVIATSREKNKIISKVLAEK